MYEFARIAILGGQGFLGRNLSDRLKEHGYKHVSDFHSSKTNDFTKQGTAEHFVKNNHYDVIINCAGAVGGIGANMERPADFYWKNQQLCGNLIDTIAKHGHVDKYIQIGTTCSYGENCPVPMKEEYLFNELPEKTNRGYGVSKLAILYMMQAYRQQYKDFRGIYLIPTNMVGKYDNFDPYNSHVVPAILRKMHISHKSRETIKDVVIWGDGSGSRDFLDARDAADGIIEAMEKYDGAEPINLGSGKEVTIKEVVKIIYDIVEPAGNVVWDKSKPNGQQKRCLDISRAKELLGWEPKIALQQSIQDAYEWAVSNKVL